MTATVNAPRVILVAEDDEDILKLVAVALAGEGYEIDTAADGEEALGCLSTRRPDLAVLDLRMPRIDGFEVSRRIREGADTRDVPVILLTALVEGKDIARGFDAGATDYVKKPFSPSDLVARVKRILGR